MFIWNTETFKNRDPLTIYTCTVQYLIHFQYSSQIYQAMVGPKLYKFQQYSTVI